jgi:hypothetical protein
MTEQTINNLIDLAKILAPSVILPIFILWLTNRNSRENRKSEQEFELKKIESAKVIEDKYSIENQKKSHEIIVHSSLIKILFEVQKLHIALSSSCVDKNCISDACKTFSESFAKYQSVISENQIFLSSKVTNQLYKFYKDLGQLMIELNNINEVNEFQCGIVPVYNYSQNLADNIIEIQTEFVNKRAYLETSFKSIDLPEFRSCCGNSPTKEQQELYDRLKEEKFQIKKQINSLPDRIESTIERC